jgi:hypothetical protein
MPLTSTQMNALREYLRAAESLRTAYSFVKTSASMLRDEMHAHYTGFEPDHEEILRARKALIDLQSISSRMQRYLLTIRPVEGSPGLRRQIRLPNGE